MALFKFSRKPKKGEALLDVPPPPIPETVKRPPTSDIKKAMPLPEKPLVMEERHLIEPEFPKPIAPRPVVTHPAEPITPPSLSIPRHEELEPAPSPGAELEAPPIPHRMAKPEKDLFKEEYHEAIREKKEIPKEPIFVTIKRYKKIIERIEGVRTKLKESQDTLFRLTEMESSKDEQYENWQKTLKELEKKLILIENKMFV